MFHYLIFIFNVYISSISEFKVRVSRGIMEKLWILVLLFQSFRKVFPPLFEFFFLISKFQLVFEIFVTKQISCFPGNYITFAILAGGTFLFSKIINMLIQIELPMVSIFPKLLKKWMKHFLTRLCTCFEISQYKIMKLGRNSSQIMPAKVVIEIVTRPHIQSGIVD